MVKSPGNVTLRDRNSSKAPKGRTEINELRHDKTNKVTVRPAKTQISLGIHPVLSESSLCAQWVAKDPSFLHADSEDSDQTGRIPRLIWGFAGRTAILLVLSCRGSNKCTLETTKCEHINERAYRWWNYKIWTQKLITYSGTSTQMK